MIFLVIGLNIEIHTTITDIGEAIVENLLHQLLLLDDMSCGMWLNTWWQHIQSLHGLMVAVGVVLRNLHRLQLLQSCLLGNLILTLVSIMLQVTHIGNVTHIAHLVAQMLQVTEKDIEGDGRTGMSQMGITIHGRATYIHAHIGGMKGFETLLLTMKGVVYQ